MTRLAPIHPRMKKLTVPGLLPACLAALALGCAPARTISIPAPAPVFETVAGTWGWEDEGDHTCEINPHTISFSPDWKYMLFRYPAPIDTATGRTEARYEVRGHTPNSIRAFMLGETRRNRAGELVEWDLVLVSPDRYVWHRSDWPRRASTGALERCNGKTQSA